MTTSATPQFAVDNFEEPDGPRARVKLHSRLHTTLRVTEGVVHLVAGDTETVLTPGDEAEIPAGTPYRRWNAGEALAQFVEIHRPTSGDAEPEVRPALFL